KKSAGLRKLIQHVPDLGGRHLAMIIVIEVAMHAALIAAVRNIQMHGDRYAVLDGTLAHFGHKAHGASPSSAAELRIGWSDAFRTPCLESSLTNCSASDAAVS